MDLFLSKDKKEVLEKVKMVLNKIEELSRNIGSKNLSKEISLSKREMDQPFFILVVGEYSRGKSSFINSLLGEKEFLEEGPIPTTSKITIIEHMDTVIDYFIEEEEIIKKYHPATWLKDIVLVDTPGINSVMKEHEKLTNKFLPKADIVFFVLSADQPLSRSELEFLKLIKSYSGNIVIILNKIDLLEGNEQDLQKQQNFIIQELKRNIGSSLEIIRFSAKLAKNKSSVDKSGLRQIEDFIKSKLNENKRFLIKVQKPLQKSKEIIKQYREDINKNIGLINEILKSYSEFKDGMKNLESTLNRDLNDVILDIQNTIDYLMNKTEEFLEREINILNLIKSKLPSFKEEITEKFNTNVLSNVMEEIDYKVKLLVEKIRRNNDKIYMYTKNFIQSNIKKCEPFLSKSDNIYIHQIKNILETGLNHLVDFRATNFEQRIKNLDKNINISLLRSLPYASLGGAVGAGISGAAATIVVPPIPDLVILPVSLLFSAITTKFFLRKSRKNMINKMRIDLQDIKVSLTRSVENQIKSALTLSDINLIIERIFEEIKNRQSEYEKYLEKIDEIDRDIRDIEKILIEAGKIK